MTVGPSFPAPPEKHEDLPYKKPGLFVYGETRPSEGTEETSGALVVTGGD